MAERNPNCCCSCSSKLKESMIESEKLKMKEIFKEIEKKNKENLELKMDNEKIIKIKADLLRDFEILEAEYNLSTKRFHRKEEDFKLKVKSLENEKNRLDERFNTMLKIGTTSNKEVQYDLLIQFFNRLQNLFFGKQSSLPFVLAEYLDANTLKDRLTMVENRAAVLLLENGSNLNKNSSLNNSLCDSINKKLKELSTENEILGKKIDMIYTTNHSSTKSSLYDTNSNFLKYKNYSSSNFDIRKTNSSNDKLKDFYDSRKDFKNQNYNHDYRNGKNINEYVYYPINKIQEYSNHDFINLKNNTVNTANDIIGYTPYTPKFKSPNKNARIPEQNEKHQRDRTKLDPPYDSDNDRGLNIQNTHNMHKQSSNESSKDKKEGSIFSFDLKRPNHHMASNTPGLSKSFSNSKLSNSFDRSFDKSHKPSTPLRHRRTTSKSLNDSRSLSRTKSDSFYERLSTKTSCLKHISKENI